MTKEAYEQFGRWVAKQVTDDSGWLGDLDGMECGEKLLELGILEEVPYDPDVHKEVYFYHDPEPGDKVQVFAKGCEP